MTKKLLHQFKNTVRLASVLSFPLFTIIVIGWFLMAFTYVYLKEVLAFGFLTVISIFLFLVFKSEKARKYVFFFSSIILSILAFIKLSFYANYGVKISSSILFIIFETNRSEASDFLSQYFNIKVIGLLLVFLLLLFFMLKSFRRSGLKAIKFSLPFKILGIIGILISAFLIHYRFQNENLLISSILSYNDYKVAKANLKETLAKETSKEILVTKTLDEQQTYVVVIGESTSKWHMQLYGYDRETNPKLTEIKEELIVFDSVITPDVHTILALDKILTLSDFNNPNRTDNASIIQLANNAGFETFWISNQKPVGLHESIPTLIGNAAKHKNFVTTDHSSYNIYDESLLPGLLKALNSKVKKKIIFLHLIGTHSSYKRRYPKTFNRFKDFKENTITSNEKALKMINHYDNAILYNDYVVREIIEAVRLKNENSYVLYFSDHGDEVYDTMDLVGHNEFHATRPMHEVPFIVWLSEKYKQKNPRLAVNESLTNRAYMLDDFIYSFSELSHISFEGFNAEKSIFSNQFKRKTRMIKSGIDYDKK